MLTRELDTIKVCSSKLLEELDTMRACSLELTEELDIMKAHNLRLTKEVVATIKGGLKAKRGTRGGAKYRGAERKQSLTTRHMLDSKKF